MTYAASVPVVIDSRLRLPAGLDRRLVASIRREFTHANPDFHKARAMGFPTWGKDSQIKTFRAEDGDALSLPRGGLSRLRRILEDAGLYARCVDRRVRRPPVEWPELKDINLRPYQADAVQAALRAQQGIVRMATGGGKTLCALALAGETRQPTLVIMQNRKLLEQWLDRAVSQLGLSEREIGVLRGGTKLRVGPRLTLALQQTLYSRSFPIEEVAPLFGAVLVDEAQDIGATTFQRVVDAFPALYRVGFSADERRSDGKEFVVYDTMGAVIAEYTRADLEGQRVIVPVDARLVPTAFEARWYSTAEPGERDFNRLLDEMTTDAERNAQLVELVRSLLERGETPILLFTHRVEHARRLADELLFAAGIKAGLLIGEKGYETRFAEDKVRLSRGQIPIACGTLSAIGKGIDMPAVQSGILATPIANNPQFFNQVRGRTCRVAAGKSAAGLYVLWDQTIYPRLLKTVRAWNDGRASVVGE